jgi:hypothetical protein
VAFADKHLASVLTNPLLTKSDGVKKPALNLESAKRELEQNPDRDPISLLEEYHEQGAATVPIADLCLKTFRQSLAELSLEVRQTKTTKTQAGVRTLRWLWRSELYQTDAFVENRGLMGALVDMIAEEDKEHFLWSWLRLDVNLGNQIKDSSRYHSTPRNYLYRWKDFTLRHIVLSRLDKRNPKTLNDVLDMYFKAVDLHLDVAQTSTTNHVPLGSAINAINNNIFINRRSREEWDVKRYDRYIQTMVLREERPLLHWTNHYKALLRLTHPRNPSPLPMFESLKESFLAEPTSQEGSIYGSFANQYDHHPEPRRRKIRLLKYYKLVETTQQLKNSGYTEETEWMVSMMRSLFPELETYLEQNLNNEPKPPTHQPLPRGVIRVALPSFTGAGTA